MEDKIDAVLSEIQKIRTEFHSDQQETRKLIEDKLVQDEIENEKINRKLETHDSKISHFEKEARKRNIVIYGMKEEDGEKFADLKEKVRHIFNTIMKLDVKREEIDDFFRLGKKTGSDRTRPILVKLVSNWRKMEIMRNKNQLKGTKIFIENDLSEEESTEKKKMVQTMKDLKSKGHQVYIKGKVLIVDGKQIDTEDFSDEDMEVVDDEASKQGVNGKGTTQTSTTSLIAKTASKRPSSPTRIDETAKNANFEKIVKKSKRNQLILNQRARAKSAGQQTLNEMFQQMQPPGRSDKETRPSLNERDKQNDTLGGTSILNNEESTKEKEPADTVKEQRTTDVRKDEETLSTETTKETEK
ncbi:hypothetical protein WDU94_005437 [Cyamophila willieti]